MFAPHPPSSPDLPSHIIEGCQPLGFSPQTEALFQKNHWPLINQQPSIPHLRCCHHGSPWVTMGHTHSSSHGGSGSMANRNRERLEVPIPYNSGLCFWAMFLGMYPQNMVKNMVKNMVPPFEDPGDPLTGHCGCQVSNTRRSSSARPAKRWCAARLAQQE